MPSALNSNCTMTVISFPPFSPLHRSLVLSGGGPGESFSRQTPALGVVINNSSPVALYYSLLIYFSGMPECHSWGKNKSVVEMRHSRLNSLMHTSSITAITTLLFMQMCAPAGQTVPDAFIWPGSGSDHTVGALNGYCYWPIIKMIILLTLAAASLWHFWILLLQKLFG